MPGIHLEMNHITKRFPGVLALNDVSISVEKGEIHALLGENGAGKSTLIKVLAGAFPADAGEILLEGKPVHIGKPWEAQALGIIVMHQEINMIPALDVATNIALNKEPSKWFHLDKKAMHESARHSLSMLDFDIKTTAVMKDLSFAQMQMVEIARAVSKNPKIIVMDEPTASLTNKEKDDLYRVIRLLKEKGVSIIYITHLLDEVFRFADRVSVLRDGQHIGTHPVAEMDVGKLIQMMVGRKLEYTQRQSVCTDEVVLEVKSLSQKGVLQDISFSLKKGEILGIAGLAGAGRTELARAIFGADKHSGGEIIKDGASLKINRPSDAMKNSVGLVPEERKTQGLMMLMPIRENINITSFEKVSRFWHLNFKQMRTRAERFIGMLNINPNHPLRIVSKLSGGNQQKVVVAKSMCGDMDILIIDEPTRGMDVGAKDEIHNILHGMAARGKSIIMISSEMPELLKMCDRILVMRDGRLTGELDQSEATQEKILRYAMGGTDA